MDSREAKEILALFRPGGLDAADPRVAEALEQVQRDPELAAWFAEHSAVNAAIRAKLKAIPVPPALRRRIIISQIERRRIISFPVITKVAAAVAAVLLVGFLISRWVKPPPNEYTFFNFRSRMARSVQRDVKYMDMESTNQADILKFCHDKGADTDFALPSNLRPLPGEGGSVLKWNNNDVVMLCLNSGTNGVRSDLWLFVADQSVIPNPPSSKPVFLEVGQLMTASWTENGKVFVLAGPGGQTDLQKFTE